MKPTDKKKGTRGAGTAKPKKPAATGRRAKLLAKMLELGDVMNRLDGLEPMLNAVNEHAAESLNGAWCEISPEFTRVALAYVRTFRRAC